MSDLQPIFYAVMAMVSLSLAILCSLGAILIGIILISP